jgi:5-formaminoimidazole-4-carboxamide-1-beta-D-ribofuranosyl 5'-monophosphate synthetase
MSDIKPILYITGNNKSQENAIAINTIAESWSSVGHEVFSCNMGENIVDRLILMFGCQMILVVDGWNQDKDCLMEVILAQESGMPIMYSSGKEFDCKVLIKLSYNNSEAEILIN